MTDIELVARGNELCFVDEWKIARNAAAIDVNWTLGRVCLRFPRARKDSRDSITWRVKTWVITAT